MNKEYSRIDFKDENELSELLHSDDMSAQETRKDYVARLKKGECLVAAIAGFPSCALVLESSQVDKLKAVPLS